MKLGNRKKNRDQYLLDVKVQTEGRLRRRAGVAAAVLAVVGVLGLTGYGVYRLGKFGVSGLVYENERFAITRIDVENNGVMTPERVMQFAGVKRGQNLYALDLNQVRRNLEMIPLVRHVSVRRVLPNRLIIHVEERTAAARLRVPSKELSDAVFLIDRAGVVMKPLKLSDGTMLQPNAPRTVPLLTGVMPSDVRVGRPVESPQIYRALELLERLEQSGAGAALEVEQIDLSRMHQLVVTTRQHSVVKFDVEDFSKQLRRLVVILNWAQQRQKSVQTVDLTVSRGVPVTFVN